MTRGVCELCGYADDRYRIEENGTVMRVCKSCHDGYLKRMGLSPDADKPIEDVALTLDLSSVKEAGIDTEGMSGAELLQLKMELDERKKATKVPSLNEAQLDTLLTATDDEYKRVQASARQREQRRKKKAAQAGDDDSGEDYQASEELLRSGEELQRAVAGLEKIAEGDDLLGEPDESAAPIIAKIVAPQVNSEPANSVREKPEERETQEEPLQESAAAKTPPESTAQEELQEDEQAYIAESETATEETADDSTGERAAEEQIIPERAEERTAEEETPPEQAIDEQAAGNDTERQAADERMIPEQAEEEIPDRAAEERAEEKRDAPQEPAEEEARGQTALAQEKPTESDEPPTDESEKVPEREEVEATESNHREEPDMKKEQDAAVKEESHSDRVREKIRAAAHQSIDDERIQITSPEVALSKDKRPKTNFDVATSEYTGSVRFLDAFKYVMHRVSYTILLALIVLAVSTVLFIEDWHKGVIVLGCGAGAIAVGFLLMWYLSHCYELDRRAQLLRIRQQEILFDSMHGECYRELRTKFTVIKALGWLLNKLSVLLPLVTVVGGNIAGVILSFVLKDMYWLYPVVSACASAAGVLVYYVIKFAADVTAYTLDRERNQQIQQQTLLDILDELRKK